MRSHGHHRSQMTPTEFKKRYRIMLHEFEMLLVLLRPELSSFDVNQAGTTLERWLNVPSMDCFSSSLSSLSQIINNSFRITSLRRRQRDPCGDQARIYSSFPRRRYVWRPSFHLPCVKGGLCIWRVFDAINVALPVEFPIDDDKLGMLERGFRSVSRVEAGVSVDRCHFALASPGKSADKPNSYDVA